MRSLSSNISRACSVLRELASALEQYSETKLCSPAAFATTKDVLKKCKVILRRSTMRSNMIRKKKTNMLLRGSQKLTSAFHGPDLDLLKSNLERLKATMLLMLNVTMYAGQIRSFYRGSIIILYSEKLPQILNSPRLYLLSRWTKQSMNWSCNGQQ
jgi:hypothetical protein